MKWFIWSVLMTMTSGVSNAQLQSAGGRSASMAGSGVAMGDVWSVFHNQAGLAALEKVTAGLFNHTPFLLEELSTRGVAVAIPVPQKGVFGLSMGYYGYALYNEKQAGLAYARGFGENVAVGVQFDYVGTSISEGYGSGHAFTFEAGFRAQIMPDLYLGAHVYNPAQLDRSSDSDEPLPSLFTAGFAYQPSEKVLLSLETGKELREANVFRAGIEYRPVHALYLRAGFATAPVTTAFGVGLVIDAFRFDVAAGHHPDLGYSPTVSLSYQFK